MAKNDIPLSWEEGKRPTPTHRTFEAAISANATGCITWPHKKSNKGYAQIRIDGKVRHANRLMCETVYGLPPTPEHYACHKPLICHNRACINPNHLYWGTASENTYDKRLDGTDNRGEKNPASKLKASDILAIRASKQTQREIAVNFGVTQAYVSKIKNREKWRHV